VVDNTYRVDPALMDLQTWKAPAGDGPIPNHPRFPVLIYHGVATGEIKRVFAAHGWGGAWTDGVFDFHHFHSTSHEVLAVVSGSATLELGGPQGEAFEVTQGDVLVLPAGTGHRRASGRDGFTVVGAYPAGQEDYDLLREADDAARERISAVPVPDQDPVGGQGIARWS
jgi:uncharacterized protein YjlB